MEKVRAMTRRMLNEVTDVCNSKGAEHRHSKYDEDLHGDDSLVSKIVKDMGDS